MQARLIRHIAAILPLGAALLCAQVNPAIATPTTRLVEATEGVRRADAKRHVDGIGSELFEGLFCVLCAQLELSGRLAFHGGVTRGAVDGHDDHLRQTCVSGARTGLTRR